MRILMVSNYQPPHMGGIEFAAESLKRCWEENGHVVTWLTTDIPRGARPATQDNVRVWATNFLEDLWQINSPLPCPRTYPEIVRLIKAHDAVNVHSLAPGLSTVALYAALRRRKPTVATQHVGVIPLPLKLLSYVQEKFLCCVVQWGAQKGAKITFVGRAVRDWFVEKTSLPEGAVHMTPAGIDQKNYYFVPAEERRTLRAKWKLSDTRLNVLFVGRFYEKKGMPLLREVAARSPDVHFTFVGSGPLSPEAWGLANAHVISFVPTAELRELYGSHDLFLMPSVGEGWPAVVPQAMACGLACLLSEETFQGYREDPAMFVIRPRTAEAMIAALKDVRAGKIPLVREREKLSEYSRQHWDWMRTARIYLGIFEELITAEARSHAS